MEEELQKRNTDCVYFLASPLTCRKGAECEYRHSEIARLNPRDCWFWLSGNCLNPSCSFRHPPLEKPAESASESDSLQQQVSVPTNKINVPCYFYFNGFCNKGDKCSFLHGPETFTGKSAKISAVTDGLLPDNKMSVANDIVPAQRKAHVNPPEAVPKVVVDLKMQRKEDVQTAVPKRMIHESPSQIVVSQHEEAALVNSSSMLPAGDLVPSKSYISLYQNSEEQLDDHVEPEERLESSPGFDVLVDDKSEYLAYKDDEEYGQTLERDHGELNSHFLSDDFADPAEYDPAYPDAGHFFESEMIDSYDCVDNVHVYDDVGKESGCSGDIMLDSALSRKRKLLPTEMEIGDRRGVDLRDHLRKRRVSDGRAAGRLGRSSDSSHLLRQSEERPQRHGMSQQLRGRLVLEVGNTGFESLGDNGTLSNGGNQHGWIHNTQSRQHYIDRKPVKRLFLPSEVSRKPGLRERRSADESVAFSGPKTLAQIKEEKKKAEENGDCTVVVGQSSQMSSADFEGPKPLSEILKDKRRLGSVVAASES